MEINIHAHNLPHAQGGYIGRRVSRGETYYNLKELKRMGFLYVAWDGEYVIILFFVAFRLIKSPFSACRCSSRTRMGTSLRGLLVRRGRRKRARRFRRVTYGPWTKLMPSSTSPIRTDVVSLISSYRGFHMEEAKRYVALKSSPHYIAIKMQVQQPGNLRLSKRNREVLSRRAAKASDAVVPQG